MSSVWRIADQVAGELERERPDCDGTGWTDPRCAQAAAGEAPPAEPARKPVSAAPCDNLYIVFFDALPGRQFRVMARTGSHAVRRIRTAYDFPAAWLFTFCAYLAC